MSDISTFENKTESTLALLGIKVNQPFRLVHSKSVYLITTGLVIRCQKPDTQDFVSLKQVEAMDLLKNIIIGMYEIVPYYEKPDPPKEGETYWYIDDIGRSRETVYSSEEWHNVDKFRVQNGNFYKSSDESLFVSHRMQLAKIQAEKDYRNR